jgi:hypothetical protein
MNDELIKKHFGDEGGFSRVSNTLIRLYTLLDDFDVTTAGLYAYLRSWRNSDPKSKMYNIVWLSREYMYEQSGLKRKAFNKRLNVLRKYGLVSVVKSKTVANKDYFIVHDPLERDEFLRRFPEVAERFIETAAEIDSKNKEYRQRKLAEEIEAARLEHAKKWNVQKEQSGVSKTDNP